VPIVGGSGALAAVMGAYLVLFPGSKVLFLLPIIATIDIVEVPVVFFVVIWLFLQILSGIGRLADVAPAGGITLVSLAVGVGIGAALGYVARRTGRAYSW
jgi:membrane associated rhomboid family serine protease